MSDVLTRPVHVALLRPTYIATLAAQKKIVATPYGIDPNVEPVALPKERKERPYHTNFRELHGSNPVKQAKRQVQLRVLHDSIPEIPADKKPPCSSCKAAPCCTVFLVNLTQLEYESGVYGDAAVELTPQIFKQFQGRSSQLELLAAPQSTSTEESAYYLEGKMGERCPFLTDSNQCGIYDIRPKTCRTYTCVGDSRITEEMRQGIEPLDAFTTLLRHKELADAQRDSE